MIKPSELFKQREQGNAETIQRKHRLEGSVESLADHAAFKQSTQGDIQPPLIPPESLLDGEKKLAHSRAAKRIANHLTGWLGMDKKTGIYHQFIGSHWRPDTDGTGSFDRLISEQLDVGCMEAGYSDGYARGVSSRIQKYGTLLLPEFDNTDVLPFQNGLLDLNSKSLMAATPTTARTWVLPFEYEPESDCESVKQWLLQVTGGDKDTAHFLRAWLAALLHGRYDLHSFLHLIGTGSSGKSTFIQLAQRLVGSGNISETDFHSMEQNRFETANFYQKRLITMSDANRYQGSTGILKRLTGGDSVRMERKHQTAGSFLYKGMVLVSSNEQMSFADSNSGLERRRITVPFFCQFSDQDTAEWNDGGGVDGQLFDKLPGLINWLLELSQGEIETAFKNLPAVVIDQNEQARAASDSAFAWYQVSVRIDTHQQAQVGDKTKENGCYANTDTRLYPNYLMWCEQMGIDKPHGVRAFKAKLLEIVRHIDGVEFITPQNKRTFKGLQVINKYLAEHKQDE